MTTIQFQTTLLNQDDHLYFEVKVSVPEDSLTHYSKLRLSGYHITPHWGEDEENNMRSVSQSFKVTSATCSESFDSDMTEAKEKVENFISECGDTWNQYCS